MKQKKQELAVLSPSQREAVKQSQARKIRRGAFDLVPAQRRVRRKGQRGPLRRAVHAGGKVRAVGAGQLLFDPRRLAQIAPDAVDHGGVLPSVFLFILPHPARGRNARARRRAKLGRTA